MRVPAPWRDFQILGPVTGRLRRNFAVGRDNSRGTESSDSPLERDGFEPLVPPDFHK